MIKKHLNATVIIAVGVIIFHSIIFDAITNFLLAGALPIVPISLPSWMMFLLASITLVIAARWVMINQLHLTIPTIPRLQALNKKTQPKGNKTSRPKPKPAS